MLASTKPKDKNLVSVLVRTTFRASLSRAIRSVDVQSYRPIEIVLVDALGGGQSFPRTGADGIEFAPISKGHALSRSAAANVAVAAARGSLLVFLDDDDTFDPGHVFSLTRTLALNPDARLAYSGSQMIDSSGVCVGKVHEHFSPMRLFRRNYLTMGSVLFARDLLDSGCRFDEELEGLEDWDFWLQALRHTRFAFSGEDTYLWNVAEGESGFGVGTNRDESRFRQAQSRLIEKWGGAFEKLGKDFSDFANSGVVREKIGETQAAETDYRRALAIDPDSVNVLNRLALLLVKQRRFAEGDSLLTRAIGSDPQNTDLRINRAVLFETAGRKNDAAQILKEILAVDPRHERALEIAKKLQISGPGR